MDLAATGRADEHYAGKAAEEMQTTIGVCHNKKMVTPFLGPICFITAMSLLWPIGNVQADDDPPLTRNVPMQEFQNRAEDAKPYNFDAPPEGLFRTIQLAEGFEEEMGIRRTHDIVPVSVTDSFQPDSAVFIVFSVYQHLDSYQVSALCYPEHVPGFQSQTLLAEDAMYVALEDDSGYLRLDAPPGGWKPGRYKAEIHVGWTINEISLIGTMRFTVMDGQSKSPSSETR